MNKILIILIFFPIYFYAQNITVSEFIISDSIKNDICYQKNFGIEKAILSLTINQEIKLYSLEQHSENCKVFRLIKKKEDLKIIKKSNNSGIAEIYSTDYLMVYKDSNYLQIHKMYDGFSDSVRVMATGEEIDIVNGRDFLERIFTLNDIEKIYFLSETNTNKLIAFSFKLKLNFIELPNAWFKVDEINANDQLNNFMKLINELSSNEKVSIIEKIKLCN